MATTLETVTANMHFCNNFKLLIKMGFYEVYPTMVGPNITLTEEERC